MSKLVVLLLVPFRSAVSQTTLVCALSQESALRVQGTVRLALFCSYRRTTGVHLPVFTLKALPWRDSSGGGEQNDKNLLRDASVLGTEDNRDR